MTDSLPPHAPDTSKTPANFAKRLAWLLACIGAGLLVGLAGDALSDNKMWYAAVPAFMAAGWLFFADPSQCEPPVTKKIPHNNE